MMRMGWPLRSLSCLFQFLCVHAVSLSASDGQRPARMPASSPGTVLKGGWTYVHLEGSPAEIGFQHGQLLVG